MGNWKLSCIGLALLTLAAALPAVADTEFRVRKMNRNDVPLGKGQCDIRLQVDNEVEVTVRGDVVRIRTIAGQDARDDGSECNAPLPGGEVRGFNYQAVETRNEMRLLTEPSRRNGFAAIVRIRDGSGGFGRYHFRLSWDMTGTGDTRPDERRDDMNRPDDRRFPPPEERRGGMAWNNTIHYSGSGRGMSESEGFPPRRLSDVSVDIDRGGHIQVSFRTEGGRTLLFNGMVMEQQGENIKADVATEDRRLRGSMFVSLDNRRDVYRITLEATDGRDHLRLNWGRR